MPSGIFDFLSVRNYNKIKQGVQRAKPFAGGGNNPEGSAEGEALCRGVGCPHITLLLPAAGGGTIRRLEKLLNQIENFGIRYSCRHRTRQQQRNVYKQASTLFMTTS